MKIRHLLLVAILTLTTVATAVAQAPLSFTYQAVVRNSSGRLVSNATVGVKISIVRDSATGQVVYSGVQTPRTNANGLFTLVIGDSQNGIDTITWRNGPYFLKSEVDPNGGSNYTLTSVQQMLSVPYALHAHTVDNVIGGVNFIERQVLSMNGDTVFLTGGSYVVLPPSFSGDYNDLTNKPTIPTNVSAFNNDAGYLTSATLTETQVLSIRHDTVFLTGGSFVKLPAGFSGNYNDLTNKPTIPTNVSAFTNDAGYLTSATLTETQVLSISHDTVFLTGGSFVKLPAGFSGNYNDLTNKPTIPTVPTNVSAFTNDAGYLTNATLTETQVLSIRHDTVFLTGGSFVKLPAGFSGNYNDLTNKPTIPTVPTNVSAFTNDAGYLTSYTETQVLSKRGDTISLTGGSFVVLPAETQNLSDVATNNDSVNSQIKNLYDPTDSMDAVNLRTLSTIIGRLDSIITYQNRVIDTLRQEASNITITLPTITTTATSNVTDSTATSGGNVTSDGGAVVSASGVCWSTSHNPTISGNHTINSNVTGNFTSYITGLTAGTTYYVRAYATNSAGTAYGNEMSFTATSPALAGLFSVSATQQIQFSTGNLQWSKTGGGISSTTHITADGTAQGKWRFADHQYDYIGIDNNNASSAYTGWLDLFAFGASGYNGAYPYIKQDNNGNCFTLPNTWGIQMSYYDWGVYNSIYNPRTNANDTHGTWRTLTSSEWGYLLFSRTGNSQKYGLGVVNGVYGLILLPDNWTQLVGVSFVAGASSWANNYNISQWTQMETNGAVFLPAAGYRTNSMNAINSEGYYSSSNFGANEACSYKLRFLNNKVELNNQSSRCYGVSIRLVRNAD